MRFVRHRHGGNYVAIIIIKSIISTREEILPLFKSVASRGSFPPRRPSRRQVANASSRRAESRAASVASPIVTRLIRHFPQPRSSRRDRSGSGDTRKRRRKKRKKRREFRRSYGHSSVRSTRVCVTVDACDSAR